MKGEWRNPALGKLLWSVVIIAAFKTVWCGVAAFSVLQSEASQDHSKWLIFLLVTVWPLTLILILTGSKWAIVPGSIPLGEAAYSFWDALKLTQWAQAVPTEMQPVFWGYWLGAFTIPLIVFVVIFRAKLRQKLA